MGSTLKPTQGGSEKSYKSEKETKSQHKSGYYFMNFATFIDFLNCLYINEVEDAKENNNLDLSDCQLQQVPDAIFMLMQNTSLVSCNLSHNVINKIPAKLAIKWTLLTELNVSHNRISSLPDELSHCTALETVDFSANSFIQMPPVLAEIPSLIKIVASKNFIADVEVEALQYLPNLEHVNVEGNPLKKEVHDQLSKVTSIRVILSPREQEEWEDLSC